MLCRWRRMLRLALILSCHSRPRCRGTRAVLTLRPPTSAPCQSVYGLPPTESKQTGAASKRAAPGPADGSGSAWRVAAPNGGDRGDVAAWSVRRVTETIPMSQKRREYVGHIFVDHGGLVVLDPMYGDLSDKDRESC